MPARAKPKARNDPLQRLFVGICGCQIRLTAMILRQDIIVKPDYVDLLRQALRLWGTTGTGGRYAFSRR